MLIFQVVIGDNFDICVKKKRNVQKYKYKPWQGEGPPRLALPWSSVLCCTVLLCTLLCSILALLHSTLLVL